jgi:hypothetical protein
MSEGSSDENSKRKAPEEGEDDTATAEERRARNRKSAYQSRLRKRMLIEELQGKVSVLTKDLEMLRDENRTLLHQMEMVTSENTRMMLINQQETFTARQHHQHMMNGGPTVAQQGMGQLNGLGLGAHGGSAAWNGLTAQMSAAQMNALGAAGLGGVNGFHQHLAGLQAMQQQMQGQTFQQALLAGNLLTIPVHGDVAGEEGNDGALATGIRPNPNGATEL